MTEPRSAPPDIVIAGGSLTGASLALALASAGFAVTVIDPTPPDAQQSRDFDGRSYALAHASVRMLKVLGVWDRIAADSQPILQVKASDGRAGEGAAPLFLSLDHAEIDEGPMGWMIEDRYLRRALLEALADAPQVRFLAGRRVTAQAPARAGVNVTLDDGTVLDAALLVGADGRQSQTATRAGIRRTGWSYGQTALVCAIEHDQPHEGIAHQFFMPEGPLAILPLPGNRSSIVWTERDDRAVLVNRLNEDDYLAVLRPRFGGFLGDIRLAGVRFSYPLALSMAQTVTADRVVLVGDAAQGVHPIAGQGLNQGLRDVATLADVVTDARRRGEDVGSFGVLDRHRSWRSFDRAALGLATDGFNRLFSNDNPLLRLGRDLGMGLTNRLPGLRQRLMREAAGLEGELPRLLRGRSL
ncbi:MAG: UbiH/UbiF/VisC/COQ6 family ubiquinone biosynthesis hydroxylase [Celeribacter sp.]